MKDIDIAIGILDKLIAREREAADNGMRMGNGLLSAPPRSGAQAVKDVLADHLGDFGSEGVLEPCINAHGRIVCGCGWMAKGPDVEDWYGHLAAAMEDGLDGVAAEAVGGHGPDGEPGE